MVKSRFLELAKWHTMKKEEKEASQQGFYFPWLKVDIDELFGGILKKYASHYFQFKTGHSVFGIFLAKIKVIKTPKCL